MSTSVLEPLPGKLHIKYSLFIETFITETNQFGYYNYFLSKHIRYTFILSTKNICVIRNSTFWAISIKIGIILIRRISTVSEDLKLR